MRDPRFRGDDTLKNFGEYAEKWYDFNEMHEPVLVNEVIQLLGVKEKGIYLDGEIEFE